MIGLHSQCVGRWLNSVVPYVLLDGRQATWGASDIVYGPSCVIESAAVAIAPVQRCRGRLCRVVGPCGRNANRSPGRTEGRYRCDMGSGFLGGGAGLLA